MSDLTELSFRPKANVKGNQTPICILSPDAPESDLYQYLVHVRAQIKKWQALHRDSLAGKNAIYGIKAACNMAYAGESLVDAINDIFVEKCAK